MSYLSRYRERVGLGTNSAKEEILLQMRMQFESQIEESLSGVEVLATEPNEVTITQNSKTIKCIINDLTNNDKRALDEKQILVNIDENIDVGCYVFWDNCYWLLLFKEHKVVQAYKKFIMRRCNQIFKYKYKGRVYSIPISIENLTMYSDGLADLKYTSQQDAKRMISFGSNPITRTVVSNTRIMLTGKTVFRVTHINDFEFNGASTGANGLIKCLVLQTTLIPEDDVINNIAYNDESEVETEEQPSSVPKILGDNKVFIGASGLYKCSSTKVKVKWELTKVNGLELAQITKQDSNQCELATVLDSRMAGQKFILKMINADRGNIYDTKEIVLKGFV